ncbi:MAG: GNAT family N-acetyltransferase [Pseudomonadota bacterium]
MAERGGISIRMAERSDAPEIARMMREFDEHLAKLDGSEPWIDVNSATRKLVRLGFEEQSLFSCLLAEVEGRPVAYAIYHIGFWADDIEGAVFLTDLFVRTEARQKGFGKALMARLGQIGRERDCEKILWTVWRQNPAAQEFYESLGAKAIEDELFMSLAI